MRPAAILGTVLVGILAASGCSTRHVTRNGDNMRSSVCDLYTEQTMDSLIRARNNEPFVLLTYRDLLFQNTDTVNAAGGIDQTVLSTTGAPPDGILGALTTFYTAAGGASRSRILSFHADPVMGRSDLYAAVIDFAHNPLTFVEADTPPDFPVQIYRKRHKKHYWVPCEAGPAFMSLALTTSFQPPAETPVSPAYDVAIDAVDKIEPVGRDNLFNVTLRFNSPVPKGEGTLVLNLPGQDRQIRFDVYPILGGEEPEGVSVTRLKTQFDPAKLGIEAGQLAGLSGQLFSYRFPKVVPPQRMAGSQELYNELDRIRSLFR